LTAPPIRNVLCRAADDGGVLDAFCRLITVEERAALGRPEPEIIQILARLGLDPTVVSPAAKPIS
jgi:hypothetical protein